MGKIGCLPYQKKNVHVSILHPRSRPIHGEISHSSRGDLALLIQDPRNTRETRKHTRIVELESEKIINKTEKSRYWSLMSPLSTILPSMIIFFSRNLPLNIFGLLL